MIQIGFSSKRIDKDLLTEGLAIVGLARIGGLIPDERVEPGDLEPDDLEEEAGDPNTPDGG